jgi:hypothetical protein
MTQADFSLSLDLQGALALFLLVERRPSGANRDLEELEQALRDYLYERLSIAEMEEPDSLYERMRSRREGNVKANDR